ncbi:hypothetical protein [Streptomyces sp. H27-S2]|uniref:hypothetical protein n=1 Tax=Streptomyces antarcticus TaxID=2996458 RepID=UPI00226DE5A7|nr:hypothetical protein [Streptomyces sp. H27-S2]MCY0955281.1 hypothetical protein [Streptomyces sp. H27-S2]
MSTATDPQPQTPQQPLRPPQQPSTDLLLTLCLLTVGALVLVMAGYLCIAAVHSPSVDAATPHLGCSLFRAWGGVI